MSFSGRKTFREEWEKTLDDPKRAIGSEHLIIVKIHPVSKIKLHSLPTFPSEFLICVAFLAYSSAVNVCPMVCPHSRLIIIK